MQIDIPDLRRKVIDYLHKLRSGEASGDWPLVVDMGEAQRQGVTMRDIFGTELEELRSALGAFRPVRPLEHIPFRDLVDELLAPMVGGRVNPEFVFRWLRTQVRDGGRKLDCPICASNQWIVGAKVVQTVGYPSSWENVKYGYPLVVVTCFICAYTFFLNAMLMGVVGNDGSHHGEYRG